MCWFAASFSFSEIKLRLTLDMPIVCVPTLPQCGSSDPKQLNLTTIDPLTPQRYPDAGGVSQFSNAHPEVTMKIYSYSRSEGPVGNTLQVLMSMILQFL